MMLDLDSEFYNKIKSRILNSIAFRIKNCKNNLEAVYYIFVVIQNES